MTAPKAAHPGIRRVIVTRYVTPLREGGSLPAIVEADDLGTYVLKFRGAGQGPRVLVAELLAGEIARTLGLPMPDIVFAEVDPALGRAEPDPEIQDLLTASAGLNLALDFLPGSFAYDPYAAPPVDRELASLIVWFDALVTNVDRTVKNTNMLLWHRQLYLIDHGACFYAQYAGPDFPARARDSFPLIRDHVLIRRARSLRDVDEWAAQRLEPTAVEYLVSLLPDAWLEGAGFTDPASHRAAFVRYLADRLQKPRPFLQDAIDAAQSV